MKHLKHNLRKLSSFSSLFYMNYIHCSFSATSSYLRDRSTEIASLYSSLLFITPTLTMHVPLVLQAVQHACTSSSTLLLQRLQSSGEEEKRRLRERISGSYHYIYTLFDCLLVSQRTACRTRAWCLLFFRVSPDSVSIKDGASVLTSDSQTCGLTTIANYADL